MQYRIEDSFATSAARYWDVFFDEGYNAALFAHLEIDRELLQLEREGEGDAQVIRRVQRLTPRRDVPAALRRMIAGAVSYTETNLLRRATDAMDTVTVPSFMADKITTRGVYRLERRGTSEVLRVWDAECTAKIPLIGGTVERFIVDQVRDSYAKTAEFTRRWLAEHPG